MVRDCRSAGDAAARGLWSQLGLRLRDRRTQLGLSEGVVAAHLGVSLQEYKGFEAGQVRVSAALLDKASDLFKTCSWARTIMNHRNQGLLRSSPSPRQRSGWPL